MPNYKVVDVEKLEKDLTSVAESIRSKAGTSGKLDFPAGYISTVSGITTGGGGGSENIVDSILDKSVVTLSTNATTIGPYVLRDCTALESISAPSVKTVGTYSLYGCTKLKDLNLPSCTTLGSYSIRGCTGLGSATLPQLSGVPTYAFYGDTELEIADMGPAASIAGNAFFGCYKLKIVVLRNTKAASLANITAFSGCYWLSATVNTAANPNGERGFIYVPRATIPSYRLATNWVTLGFYFRVLENYTVDGTITGELDINKMLTATDPGVSPSDGGLGGDDGDVGTNPVDPTPPIIGGETS